MPSQEENPQVVKQIPTIRLTGETEREYVRNLATIIRMARLNVHYPEPRQLRSHIEALSPDFHLGLYPGLEIDQRSGLPTYKEWTRVQTDCTLADQALLEMGPLERIEQKAAARPDSIYPKQLLKHKYFTALKETRLAPLAEMSVHLRRVDPATQTGYFNVVLDKLDASGLFTRFTIDLGQQSSAWSRPVVRLDEDTAAHTEEFRSLIFRFTSFDAEFTFFKLVAFGGLSVERVIKGTVGPVHFAGVQKDTGPIGELLALHKQGFVAQFSQDMAAVDLSEDRDNDPLEDPMAANLSDEAKVDYEGARGKFGYKVFKDRKFVVAENVLKDIRTFCEASGTKNIIKSVRPRRRV